MSKHTPGPWLIAEDGFITVRIGNNYPEVAKVFDAPFDDHEVPANARLIAAAPDLLEACRAMLDCCYDMDRNDETLAAVKATMKAIAKATGETK